MSKVKISCVSYLNSLPFLFGIRNHPVRTEIELSLDHPAQCAQKLINGTVQIGLVPVASIASVPDAREITSWCIGAEGPVRSVALFSQVPLSKVETILLDFQSVTSNLLVRILAAKFWKISPLFLPATEDYQKRILGPAAGVIIGDRALHSIDIYPYRYDLAGEWKKFTGLPFVFARWVSSGELDPGFVSRFDEALQLGVNHIDSLLKEHVGGDLDKETVRTYLTQNLDYRFDENKKLGMEKFLSLAAAFRDQELSIQP